MMYRRKMTVKRMSDIKIGPYFRKVFRDVRGVRYVLTHVARFLHRITWATS